MLSHDERMNLAMLVCRRMVARHGKGIVLAGICGSTATGTDTPWSDLDLLFVARDGSKLEAKQFTYRATAIRIIVTDQGELEKILTQSPFVWEYWI
jgi:predicted nucleotidyltransferase